MVLSDMLIISRAEGSSPRKTTYQQLHKKGDSYWILDQIIDGCIQYVEKLSNNFLNDELRLDYRFRLPECVHTFLYVAPTYPFPCSWKNELHSVIVVFKPFLHQSCRIAEGFYACLRKFCIFIVRDGYWSFRKFIGTQLYNIEISSFWSARSVTTANWQLMKTRSEKKKSI